MKKILKAPILYLIAIFTLLIALNVVDVSEAFNNPSGDPVIGNGGIGVATSAPASSLYITAIGNVGIGTASPSDFVTVSSSTDSLFGLYRSGATYPNIFRVGTDSVLVLNNNNVDALTLKGGNVGIGTTTPSSKLSIVGGIAVGGVLQAGQRNSRVPLNNATTSLGSGFGQYSSITTGIDGLPIIAYHDSVNGDLKVARCDDLFCRTANTSTTIDSDGDVGERTSITIGADGFPVIGYQDVTNTNFKIAKCGSFDCASSNTTTVIGSGGGSASSITIGTDGLPVASYCNASGLGVVKCGNAACSSGNTLSTVDTSCTSNSIIVGTDGYPVISYSKSNNLYVTKCGNISCSSGNTSAVVDNQSQSGLYSSITMGSDNLPAISYFYSSGSGSFLRFAKCGNASCSSSNTISTVDSGPSGGGLGVLTSVAIGSDNLPLIAYYDATNKTVNIAKCGNASCSSGNATSSIDYGVGTIADPTNISLVIGSDGLPVLSYQRVSSSVLNILKCGSENCIPYWTRR